MRLVQSASTSTKWSDVHTKQNTIQNQQQNKCQFLKRKTRSKWKSASVAMNYFLNNGLKMTVRWRKEEMAKKERNEWMKEKKIK